VYDLEIRQDKTLAKAREVLEERDKVRVDLGHCFWERVRKMIDDDDEALMNSSPAIAAFADRKHGSEFLPASKFLPVGLTPHPLVRGRIKHPS
jgi:hypothetical protein